jgi:hypothetical protein
VNKLVHTVVMFFKNASIVHLLLTLRRIDGIR